MGENKSAGSAGTLAPSGANASPASRTKTVRSGEAGVRDALTDTLRRWARPTTIEELRERGVERVRSVSMSRVTALLEKAINRALIERTVDGDVVSARSLSANVSEEFLRLARDESGDDRRQEDAALRERAATTLDRLRRQLVERKRALSEGEPTHDPEGQRDARVASKIAELFAEHAGADDRRLEQEVKSLVRSELDHAREQVRKVEVEVHRREVSILERRIAKLSTLLDETEDALRKAQRTAPVDDGVASIYGTVQGVDEEDVLFEAKSSLMRAIFEANLALRN